MVVEGLLLNGGVVSATVESFTIRTLFPTLLGAEQDHFGYDGAEHVCGVNLNALHLVVEVEVIEWLSTVRAWAAWCRDVAAFVDGHASLQRTSTLAIWFP